MLLDKSQFKDQAKFISTLTKGSSGLPPSVAFDFETTGLSSKLDKAFLLGFSYFVDNEPVNHCVFLDGLVVDDLRTFFSNPDVYYCAHNAKFEMSFLDDQFGIEVAGKIWDTEVLARVQYNNHMSYSLQNCALRLGMTKHEPMLKWLKKRGNKAAYDRAPLELICPYVEQDAYLSLVLFKNQYEEFRDWNNSSDVKIGKIVNLEVKTTKNLFEMERAGIPVDVEYCTSALAFEEMRAKKAAEEFQRLTGKIFVDSRLTFSPLFKSLELEAGRTEKGNESFDSDALAKHKGHPVVQCIIDYRDSLKRASTYWENFVDLQVNGVIYPNIRQAGAGTARFSASDPSVQNWPDDSEDAGRQYPVRRAFHARPGCKIVSIDYKQMEYRMIADEAGEMALIEEIKAGKDYHQIVADMAGVTRTIAKTVNFARLYGAGVKKIALTLGVDWGKARTIIDAMDEAAPNISAYSRGLINYAKTSPFSPNWAGRRYFFDPGFEYKYPNYRIQGGCADILRIAIDDITLILRDHKTQLLIPIHDELVFNMPETELHLIPAIKDLMINAHQSMKHLPMDVSVAIGDNFHDLEDYNG